MRKLTIHFGTQRAHPAVECNDWLIAWPPGATPGFDDAVVDVDQRGDLAFRPRVAMLGGFGIGARIDRWSEPDLTVATAHITFHRRYVRALVHHGDQYFLTAEPPGDGNGDWAAPWYAARDGRSGVSFAFRLAGFNAERYFNLPRLTGGRFHQARRVGGPAAELSGLRVETGVTARIAESFRSELLIVEPPGSPSQGD